MKIFSFDRNRFQNIELIRELAYAFLNIASMIPAGVVCFFQSFEFLNHVVSVWTESGLFSQISAKKVFRF